MSIMPPDHVCVSTNPPLTHTMFSLDKTSRNQDTEPINRTLANHAPLGGWCLTQRHLLGVVLVSRQGPLPCGAASVSGKGGRLFPSRAPIYPASACRTASARASSCFQCSLKRCPGQRSLAVLATSHGEWRRKVTANLCPAQPGPEWSSASEK